MKKVILTGDRPTGSLHIGHYFGSIKNRVLLQDSYDTYIEIADVQALTDNFNDPGKVRKNVYELAIDYLSCGIDPGKTKIFIQSQLKEIAELTIYFSNLVTVSRLMRNPTTKFEMSQKKDVFGNNGESITYGFLGYPVSQAADIAIFNADLVPVGEDQVQHLELTRDLAIRFNNRYSDTFKVPEGLVTKVGARIMDLQNPLKKMSKSEDPGDKGCIFLLDPIDLIKKKIKSAVTDSDAVVKYDKVNKPGISNLMTIYSCITGKDYKAIEAKYEGIGYGEFKADLADIVADEISKIQERYNKLINSTELDEILDKGRDEASYLARKQLSKVYRKVGLGRKK